MLSRVTYLVTAEYRPDLLARVVMLLHRLAVPIDALSVKRSGSARSVKLTLKAEVIAGQAERIAENLMKIVHVVSVDIGHRQTKYRFNSRKPRSRKLP